MGEIQGNPSFAGKSEEFYLSKLLGKKIRDNYGRTVGRVKDLVVLWSEVYPQVVGVKYSSSAQIIPITEVRELDSEGVLLRERLDLIKARPIAQDEIFVNRWLLDKQIVDIKGAKVVRVNDIKLRSQKRNGYLKIYLVAVDIGFRGLARRLGIHRFSRMFSEHLLDWQHFKPLEARTANLQLMISRTLAHLHPADIADILEDLNRPRQAEILRQLDRETAAETLAEVDPETRTNLLEAMDAQEASALVEAMPPDEAADVLGDLAEDKTEEILQLMQPEEAREVRKLMDYREGTAGSLMTTELVALQTSLTAQQAIDQLRQMAPSVETIYYIYVVDEKERLLGVVSLRELIMAPPQTLLENIMRRNVATLAPDDDHERILEITEKYALLAVPVVDEESRLLGIVTFDDVLETLLPEQRGAYLTIVRALKKH